MADVPLPNLHDLRTDYARGVADEADFSADPVEQFARWYADAETAQIPEPTAMTLATASADGTPSARIVLLKEFDARGFTFFTNYDSHKGRDLIENPQASLVFFWQALERQVRIDGSVERVSREVSKVYFDSWPRKSRIAASISHQSEVVASRQSLEDEFARLDEQFGDDVPLPEFWGGYRVVPRLIEFWQGRRSRLHDRLQYRRAGDRWVLERLAP